MCIWSTPTNGFRSQGDSRPQRRKEHRHSLRPRGGSNVVTDGMDRLSDGAKIKIAGDEAERSAAAPAPERCPAKRATLRRLRLEGRRKRWSRSDEYFPPVRTQAGGYFAADDCAGAGGPGRRALSADFIAAGRRLSDDPGADLLPRRQPHGDGDHRDRAAGSAAGRNPGPAADDLEQLRRRLGHHLAIQSCRSISTSRSRTCRRPSARPTACCRAACRRRRSYAKINPADQPILTLAVTSNSMSLTQLQDVANNRLAAKISEVPGVGLVTPCRRQRAGGPGRSGSAETGRLWTQHRRSALAARQHQCQPAEGQLRRSGSGLHDQRQRPDPGSERLSRIRSFPIRTARRCTCAMSPESASPRRTPNRAPGTTNAGDRSQCTAPARRQCDRHGRSDQEAAAGARWRRLPPA